MPCTGFAQDNKQTNRDNIMSDVPKRNVHTLASCFNTSRLQQSVHGTSMRKGQTSRQKIEREKLREIFFAAFLIILYRALPRGNRLPEGRHNLAYNEAKILLFFDCMLL